MKLTKKVIEGVLVVSLTTALTITAVTADASVVTTNPTVGKDSICVGADFETNGVAGISEILSESRNMALDDVYNTVTVENEEVATVASAAEDETSISGITLELTQEEQEWLNYLFAVTTEKLNIRESASTDSEVVGKLGQYQRATILEKGDEWTKISSGNATGYVNNAYCVFGVDALAYAEANIPLVATTTTDVNIRSDRSADSSIIKTATGGTVLTVDKSTGTVDGWVAVDAGNEVGYVSADYVNVAYQCGVATTMAEEAEIARRAAEEEAKKKQVSAPSTIYGDGILASDEEVALMAAILYCEAGASYDGMVAVGAVIVNRVKSASFPDSIYGVVYAPGQFTPARTGALASQLARGSSDTAYAAARAALSGVDPTSGCYFFRSGRSGHAGYLIGGNVFF